jgi:hypothetical protein
MLQSVFTELLCDRFGADLQEFIKEKTAYLLKNPSRRFSEPGNGNRA